MNCDPECVVFLSFSFFFLFFLPDINQTVHLTDLQRGLWLWSDTLQVFPFTGSMYSHAAPVSKCCGVGGTLPACIIYILYNDDAYETVCLETCEEN